MLAMFCLGLGLGFLSTPYLLAVQNAVPRHRRGVATSSVQFFRTIGGSIAVAALGTVLNAHLSGSSGGGIDPNVALAIFFNLMLGLTFLGIGLTQGSRSEMLGLLWGSLLFVKRSSVVVITISGLIFVAFATLFNKELKVLLFSRTIASATGVHESVVYCIFLGLCGLILAVNLPLVGGLMIFSLITCPAAAAYQICTGHKSVVVAATLFGMASAVIGFWVSYYLNLPTGACIVIISAMIFATSALYRAFRRKRD